MPDVRGVEKCFARKTGFKYHVDLHLEVDPDMTVRRSHQLAHEVQLTHPRALWTGWPTSWCTSSRRLKA